MSMEIIILWNQAFSRNSTRRYQEECWGINFFFEKVQERLSKYVDCLQSNVYNPGFSYLRGKKLLKAEVDKILLRDNYVTRNIKWFGYVVDFKK